MSYRDPYDVLEVHPSADLYEIKKAYRRLARRYHPDAQGDPGSADRFVELQNAYEAIVRRRNRQARTTPDGAQQATDSEEGYEYEVDSGDERGPAGGENSEPEPGPDDHGAWREYFGALREHLISQLWSAALLTLSIAPLAAALVISRRAGFRLGLILALLWIVVLAIIRPDRWQRG